MARLCVFGTTSYVVTVAILCTLGTSEAQALPSQYDSSAASEAAAQASGWDALGGLYALLAQHDALGGHALARKSVRSPSRRLRFGRRSDPDMLPQMPVDELEELLALRDSRTPVRLRFGRSAERAVPHIFPQEDQERQLRATPVRLRYGRRSDNMILLPIDEDHERQVRAPSVRLRYGRRSDNNMNLIPIDETAIPKEAKLNGSEEDRRLE